MSSASVGNSRLPLPRTTGKTMRFHWSTSPALCSDCASVALPATWIGPPSPSLSARTPSRSRTTVVLAQVGSCSVVETTTLGMVLNLSAKSPSRSGQAAEKPS